MSISVELGEAKQVVLDQGTIRYRERGTGPTIVFVHGVFVSGDHWRKVVPELAGNFRCITPDWPLGAHELPLGQNADVSPTGFARLAADFLAELDLTNVTLVGNDTGGALCQVIIAGHPERIGRLVLTTCDAYDNFPPRILKYLMRLAYIPGFTYGMAQSLRLGVFRRWFYGLVAKRLPEEEIMLSYIKPLRSNAAVRADVTKAMANVSAKHTLAAARKFGGFNAPVLIVWTPEDKYWFPWKYAEKLRDAFPNSRLERVEDSRCFIPEDQPKRLVELIAGFMREETEASVS